MVLDKNLYTEINDYCKENNIKTRDFIHKILREAFMKEKYGDSPFAFLKKEEKHVQEKKQPVASMEKEEKNIEKTVFESEIIETPVVNEQDVVEEVEKPSEEPIIVKKKRKLR